MNDHILKQAAVRIKIHCSGKIESFGSGVIVKNKTGNYFVITAYHCIFGKKGNKFKDIETSNIIIEYKYHNEEIFSLLRVINIEYSCDNKDIAVLSIESPHQEMICIYGKLDTLRLGSLNWFRGYPKYLQEKQEADNYECTGQSSDKEKFTIKSDKIKDLSEIKKIEATASGLSGSGIFIEKNNKPYLIGILTDLRDENGLFGQLVCKKIDDIASKFNLECSDINDPSPETLLAWNRNIDKKAIDNKINELRQSNSQQFDDLYRKCIALYGELQANEKVDLFLQKYFTSESNISSNPSLSNIYTDTFADFNDEILLGYQNRNVSNEEAQIIFIEIKRRFEELFIDNAKYPLTPPIKIGASIMATTEVLLNCNLNFIPK